MPDISLPIFGWATAAPIDTNIQNTVGRLLLNSAPGNGAPFGWICTVAGAPGTWAQIGVIGAFKQALAGSGTVSLGVAFATNSAGGTVTLGAAQSHAPGHVLRISPTSGSTTLAAGTGNAIIGGTGILSSTVAAELVTDGTTNWYRIV